VGTYSSYEIIRRCGVGVHHVTPNFERYFDAWQPLCGPVQTVPRSELSAVFLVAKKAQVEAKTGVFTGSQLTKDIHYKGLARARLAAITDLLVELFTVCPDKHLLLSLYWMSIHTKDDPKKKAKAPQWMKKWQLKANHRADSSADTAAALHVIPRDKAAPLIAGPNNLGLIQERHLAIAKPLPQRNKNIVANEDKTHTKVFRVLNACSESSHNRITKGNRIYCTECSMSICKDARHVFDILQ